MLTKSERLSLIAALVKTTRVLNASEPGIINADLKKATTLLTHAIRHSDEEIALRSVKAYAKRRRQDEENRRNLVKA